MDTGGEGMAKEGQYVDHERDWRAQARRICEQHGGNPYTEKAIAEALAAAYDLGHMEAL